MARNCEFRHSTKSLFMGYGKPVNNGRGFGHKNLAGSLKWRRCAVGIPDWDPADGVPISIAAELRPQEPESTYRTALSG